MRPRDERARVSGGGGGRLRGRGPRELEGLRPAPGIQQVAGTPLGQSLLGRAWPARPPAGGTEYTPCSRSAPARAVRVPDVREGTSAQEKPPPGARGGHQDRALCRSLGAGWDSSLLAKVPVPPVMGSLAPSWGNGQGVASDLWAGAQAVPETLRRPGEGAHVPGHSSQGLLCPPTHNSARVLRCSHPPGSSVSPPPTPTGSTLSMTLCVLFSPEDC